MGINSKSSENLRESENILIIGNGGRENSLAWAIQKNELVKKVYLIPGNAGSERMNKCERIEIDINNENELVEKLDFLKIDLIVIGPEIPLANGLADLLRKKNFKVFGPGRMDRNWNIANHGQRNLCRTQIFQLQIFGKSIL